MHPVQMEVAFRTSQPLEFGFKDLTSCKSLSSSWRLFIFTTVRYLFFSSRPLTPTHSCRGGQSFSRTRAASRARRPSWGVLLRQPSLRLPPPFVSPSSQPPECLSPKPAGRKRGRRDPLALPAPPPIHHQPPAARLPRRQGPATKESGPLGPAGGRRRPAPLPREAAEGSASPQ